MNTRRPSSAVSRARRRRNSRRRLFLTAGIILLIFVIILIVVLCLRPKPDKAVTAQAVQATPEPTATSEPTVTPEPTATPEPAPERAAIRPTATDGLLPVFWSGQTDEKIIAITVDDCFQAENLRQIVDKAIECGGKLTIFPIGENVLKQKQSEILRYAHENGFELENHTFTHNGLYGCTDEELAQEMYMQNLALSAILGVEYQAHFIRPKGGDARNDPRIHAYARQLGYYGVAHWSVSGGGSGARTLAESLQPGAIYLFHTTDKDLEKLLGFIPYAVQQGYRLVTLNEMFGYPDNETAPLTVPIEQHQAPPLEPFAQVWQTLKKGSYSSQVRSLQLKLIELGYLSGEADGAFGEGTEIALKKFQSDHGLSADGVASPEFMEKLMNL